MKTPVKGPFSNPVNEYQVTFSPTSSQLEEIEQWLIAERINTGEGFYCNWSVIKSAFEKNQLAVVTSNNNTLGFTTWWLPTAKTGHIDIMEIRPEFRKRGAGRKLTWALLQHLNETRISAVDLQCTPQSSERAWKKLGFVDFPDPSKNYKFNASADKRLYCILTEQLAPSSTPLTIETIELWNDEPYMTDENTPPSYVWNVSFLPGTRKLTQPIIQPGCYEWRLRWKIAGQTVKDDKVKRFGTSIDFGNFIIIEELP